MSLDVRTAWVALAAVPDVGERTFERLLQAYGGPVEALLAVGRLPERDGERHLQDAIRGRVAPGVMPRLRLAAADPEAVERRMARIGGWVLTPLDRSYPRRLHDLDPPPSVLYGRGDHAALDAARAVAVVGTRRPTAAARDLTARICVRLVEAGVTVVSGLAVGIDGVAHASTVEAGGRTVAVLGTNLERPGPRAHAHLAERIVATGGALVSELAPDAMPSRGTFPRRNRIISALATATIVTEAPQRSGALITARHALEQGRELLVAPGRPLDPRVAGCLALLRETPCRVLVGLDEMTVDLDLSVGHADDAASTAGGTDAPRALDGPAALELLSPSERLVATELMVAPRTLDALIAATGMPASVASAALTMLQLRGWSRPIGAIQLAAGPLLRSQGAGR